jgi:transposase-like protein
VNAATSAVKVKVGRPTSYSEAVANEIVNRMIDGENMVAICRDENMPSRSTVYQWLDANADFRARCARAREGLADYLVDQIEQMANDTDEDNYQSMKVKIATAQWRAMKMAPKIYGDRSRTEITGADGAPIQTEVKTTIDATALAPEARAALRAALKAAKDNE